MPRRKAPRAGRYYAQASDSPFASPIFATVKGASEVAQELSRIHGGAAVYWDSGTGFDPVIARYKHGRKVFDQGKYV